MQQNHQATAREKVAEALRSHAAFRVRALAASVAHGKPPSDASLISALSPAQAKAIVEANVALIRTIPADLHPGIVRYVLSVFRGKRTRDDLVDYLETRGDVTPERAALIADDQIAKASEAFSIAKWRADGFTRVMWRHGGAADPREYHKARWDGWTGLTDGIPNGLNGFVFSLNSPPVIDKRTGQRGYPATLVGCRCYLVPYD